MEQITQIFSEGESPTLIFLTFNFRNVKIWHTRQQYFDSQVLGVLKSKAYNNSIDD